MCGRVLNVWANRSPITTTRSQLVVAVKKSCYSCSRLWKGLTKIDAPLKVINIIKITKRWQVPTTRFLASNDWMGLYVYYLSVNRLEKRYSLFTFIWQFAPYSNYFSLYSCCCYWYYCGCTNVLQRPNLRLLCRQQCNRADL